MTRPASAHSVSILFAVFIPIPAFLFATKANCVEPVQEPPTLQIVLRSVNGKENGGTELLNNRFQELTKRLGHEPKGHEWWLWGLTAFDYDRDGDPDFVMSVHGPHHGVVMKNLFRETGKPTLVDVTKELELDGLVPSAAGRKPLAWDFDGDGWLDLVGVGGPHLLNQGGKKFTPSGKKIFDSFRPQTIVDLNGDGYLDIFNEHDHNGIFEPKTKTFLVESSINPAEQKISAEVRADWTARRGGPRNRFFSYSYLVDHDLNDDGQNEIIVAGYAGYGGDALGRYFLGDKSGTYVEASAKLGLPATGTPILATDLTGDGLPEVLVAADPAGGLFVSEKPGQFRREKGPLTDQLTSRDAYLHIVDVVDLDNDGDLDLVVSKPRQGPKVVFENQGQGSFATVTKQSGWDADPVAVCDINCDGRLDIAVGGPGSNVTFLLNESPGSGKFCDLSLRMKGPNINAVGSQVELFAAGDLAKPGARPRCKLPAPIDGSPVHLGLGKADSCDLRVKYPDGKLVEQRNLAVRPRMQLDHSGRLESQN